MSEKTKLKIGREGPNGGMLTSPHIFEATLNPASYTRETQFDLTCSRKLDKREPETFTLPELILDGTGVVPAGSRGPRTVAQQLESLDKIMSPVHKGAGVFVRPVVLISWGSLYFRGRIKSMTVAYTLFAPNGAPLRAKLALSFVEPEALTANTSDAKPPGLTQQMQAKGDSLPNISFTKYKDPGRAAALARLNDLDTLRAVPADKWLKY